MWYITKQFGSIKKRLCYSLKKCCKRNCGSGSSRKASSPQGSRNGRSGLGRSSTIKEPLLTSSDVDFQQL